MSEQENKRRLEELWRQKVIAAERAYLVALNQLQKIRDEYKFMPTSDGSFALQQALKSEGLARDEYTRVLQTFTRLILHGEEPPADSNPT